MNVRAEKLDDINLIFSGTVHTQSIQDRVAKLKAEAKKDDVSKEMTDEHYAQLADSEILKEFIHAGLKDAGIKVEDVLGQPGFRKYEKRDDDVYIEIAISTSPSIDTDVDFTDIIPTFTKPVAPAEEVEAKLREMAIQHAPFTSIEVPRAVAHDDVVVIDFEGFVDGVAFEGGSAQKFNLKIGSNAFIPGFEEQLIGMEYAEEKTISVTFPKDYSSADLAGKVSSFKVKLHEIQMQQASTLDDAFAQKVLNDEKASLKILKEKLADQINSQAISMLYDDELKPKLIQGLLSKFDFTLPHNIVDQEIDAKVNIILQGMDEEEAQEYTQDKEKFHAIRETMREESEGSIKAALIIEALAKKEGLEADEQEVLSALYYQAMMSGQDAEELVQYYKDNNLMHSAQMGLTQDKLFGKLLGFDK